MQDVINELKMMLNNKDYPHFQPLKVKVSIDELNDLEELSGIALPKDYKAIMRHFGGGMLEGNVEDLIFLTPAEIKTPDRIAESIDLSGIFVFAEDGSGAYYFYDLYNYAGIGKFAIFRVHPGSLSWKTSIYVGENLSHLIFKIINGDDFGEYEYLQFDDRANNVAG